MPTIEHRLETAEKIATAAGAALGAYAPLASMAIEGFKWLREKLAHKGVLTPADLAEYDAEMARWQAAIDAAQAVSDEYHALRAAEQSADSAGA